MPDKLKFDYYVNEEKRTVACKLTVPPNFVDTELGDILLRNDFYSSYCSFDDKQYEYIGVAKCHPEDTFEVDKGKRIAKLKALKKFNADKYLYFTQFSTSLYKMVEEVQNARYYAADKYNDCDNELECLRGINNGN